MGSNLVGIDKEEKFHLQSDYIFASPPLLRYTTTPLYNYLELPVPIRARINVEEPYDSCSLDQMSSADETITELERGFGNMKVGGGESSLGVSFDGKPEAAVAPGE